MVDRRRPDQRGSVLMLIPAAILVLVILGSIAVDNAIAFMGQRELQNFTASAANSAASAALDPAAFYNGGRVAIDPARAQVIVAGLESHIGGGVHDVRVSMSVQGNQVTVTATGVVDDLFSSPIPGVRHSWHVEATSRATARQVAQ